MNTAAAIVGVAVAVVLLVWVLARRRHRTGFEFWLIVRHRTADDRGDDPDDDTAAGL